MHRGGHVHRCTLADQLLSSVHVHRGAGWSNRDGCCRAVVQGLLRAGLSSKHVQLLFSSFCLHILRKNTIDTVDFFPMHQQ